MKKIFSICITTAILFSVSLASEIGIIFDGEKLESDIAPVKINSRVMVPIRVISEKAGATVDFNYETNLVTISKGDKIVKLTKDNKIAYVNDEEKILDVSAREINDRTMVPVRFVSEALGLDVDWINETVVITSRLMPNEEKADNKVIEISL